MSRPITHQVPEHLVDAFLRATGDFFSQAGTGRAASQIAAELRAQDRDAGLDALAFLVNLTQGDTGQCGIVARFLAGLYNGFDFPFDLTELRALDSDLFERCVAVLRLDNTPTVEIHRYIPDGDAVFLKMLRDWDLVKRPAPPPPPGERFTAKYRGTFTAPGYRDCTLRLTIASPNMDGAPTELSINMDDSAQLLRDLLEEHRFAWAEGRSPIDVRPGEVRPDWLP